MSESELPIDPQRSLKRSLDQLTQAIKAMDKHLASLNAEGQEGYVEGQKESLAARKVREAAWSTQQAKTPESSQLREPGSLNPQASLSDSIQAIKTAYQNQNVNAVKRAADTVMKARGIGQQQQQQPEREEPTAVEQAEQEAQELQDRRMSGLGWMDPAKMEELRTNSPQLGGYVYGGWERKARILQSRAGAAENYAVKGAAWMGEKGIPGAGALGGIGQVASKAGQYAMPLVVGSDIVKKAYAYGNQGVVSGTGLGYSGEGVPGGQFLPFGIRNPLAIFSEAGQQGLGVKAGAIENALKGNLGFGESTKLAENLAGLGFSNRHGSGIAGFLGLDNSGRNQELVELGSKAKREGLPEAEYLKMAEGIRFGGGSIKQLNENLNGLGEAAKNANTSTKVLGESMIEYAALTEKEGTKTAQEKKGKELFEITGKPGKLTAEVNATPLGAAEAARFGILPGTINNTSPQFQATVSAETLGTAAQMTRGGVVGHIANPFNPKETISSGSSMTMHAAEMAKIYGVPYQQALNYLEHEGLYQQMGPASNALERVKGEFAQEKKLHGSVPSQLAGKDWNELRLSTNKIVGDKEAARDYKLDHGGIRSTEALAKQVKENTAAAQEQAEHKAEIVLGPDAKKFFKLNFKKQWEQYEKEQKQNKGESGADNAAKNSTGKHSVPGEALDAVGNAAGTAGEAVLNHIPVVGNVAEAFGV